MSETHWQPTTVTSLLRGLNPEQLEAVQHGPDCPLQILAGPGSGKTRVLTHRIAYMILYHTIPPSSICAVTFTNKAAKEMRERLTKLIGPERTQQLKMGTFHALCAEFLRKHTSSSGVGTNFSICDYDTSLEIIGRILQKHAVYVQQKKIPLDRKKVQSIISTAKARGTIPDKIKLIYEGYQSELRRRRSLDFDDLLLEGVKLFTESEAAVSWCQYVLVDEFQDTNTAQYLLTCALARHKRLTVVGDPDQSIYAWRSADVRNLAEMCEDFPGTRQICLHQNYRSTERIVNLTSAIIARDQTRNPVSFKSSHRSGPKPFLCRLTNEYEFYPGEIKRLLAYMGGALSWGDIAILTHTNEKCSSIGKVLDKYQIPHKVVGSHKFSKNDMVKDILAYLQLVDNPDSDVAFIRACKTPKQRIDQKTLQYISERSKDSGNVPRFSIVEAICDGTLQDSKHSVKEKMSSFVAVIRTLRDLANQDTEPADLILRLIPLAGFEETLTKDEDVKNLISFATNQPKTDDAIPLRSFLQATALSASVDDNSNEDKVAISTCHSAKGLEWPVVMIPHVQAGVFPRYRSTDVEEQRRVFYVACTRAKVLLYLTYDSNPSPFVTEAQREDPTLFTDQKPEFLPEVREVICNVIGRPSPTEAEVVARVAKLAADSESDATDNRQGVVYDDIGATEAEVTARLAEF